MITVQTVGRPVSLGRAVRRRSHPLGGQRFVSTFGTGTTIQTDVGVAAVIAADDETGCTYELSNVEPLDMTVPELGEPIRRFANVACTQSPVSGAIAEFTASDGQPLVALLTGDFSALSLEPEAPTTEPVTVGAEQKDSLMLFRGTYNPGGDGMEVVAQYEGTLSDLVDTIEFRAEGVEVDLRCTAHVTDALVSEAEFG